MARAGLPTKPLVLQPAPKPSEPIVVPEAATAVQEQQQQSQNTPEQEILDANEVGGRLRFFVHEWAKITDSPFILQCIQGYKIPFSQPVFQSVAPSVHFNSALEEHECFLAIQALVKKRAVRECAPVKGQFISSYFLVPKPDGSKRFILNLKKLNKFVEVLHFKLEDIRTAQKLISKDCFMASIDLKDAYFTIPIHPAHTKFLRFIFRGILYEFVVVPFGLAPAPRLFTKLFKPVVGHLRGRGFFSALYLDDFLLFGNSFEDCQKNVFETSRLLKKIGFIISDKSSLIPSKSCRFLGFILNSKNLTMEITPDKRKSILNLLICFHNKQSCKIEDFATLVGKLGAACPAIKYGWLYTKVFERYKTLALKSSNSDYKGSMFLNEEIKEDISWWKVSIAKSFVSLEQQDFLITIFTDASDDGWGAHDDWKSVSGPWRDEEASRHINYRELLAVKLGLCKLAKNSSNGQVLLRVDNTVAISYINRMGGTHAPELNKLARDIWQWAEHRGLMLRASYIKSKDNVRADYLSRFSNLDTEWSLSLKAFRYLVSNFGSPEIDLFATFDNKKCNKYVSRFPEAHALVTDAFTISWGKFFLYAFPPFSIILRVLEKIVQDEALGILVVPDAPSQPWYPFFRSLLTRDPVFIEGNNLSLPVNYRETRHQPMQGYLMAGIVSGRRS